MKVWILLALLPFAVHADQAEVLRVKAALAAYRSRQATIESTVNALEGNLLALVIMEGDIGNVRHGTDSAIYYLDLLLRLHEEALRNLPTHYENAIQIERILVRTLVGAGIRSAELRVQAGRILDVLELAKRTRVAYETLEQLNGLITELIQTKKEDEYELLRLGAIAIKKFSVCERSVLGFEVLSR